MKKRKTSFFKRAKNAITNFDEYKTYAEENVSIAIKYILKIAIIFTIVISVTLTIRFANGANKVIQTFRDECPEFRFENDNLIIEEENKQFIKGDNTNLFAIIIDSEKENLADIEQSKDYERTLALLKDKVVIKDAENSETSITYEQLSENYDISSINKQNILNLATDRNMAIIYLIFLVISIIYLYILYLIQFILDILLVSVVGFLVSRILGINLKYKSTFNMGTYALTLSIILYMIYIVVNLFTGFEIKYFEMAYNAISYIYIITAMLMIKSDLSKMKIELTKIIKEQRKVNEEQQEENEEQNEEQNNEEKQNKEEKKNEKKKEKEKKGEEGNPEGSKA